MWLFKILPRALRDSIRKKIVETVNSSYVGEQIRNIHQDVEFLKCQQNIMIGQIESLHIQVQDLKKFFFDHSYKLERINKEIELLENKIESFNSIVNQRFEKYETKQNFISNWLYRQAPQLMPMGLHELDLIKKFCLEHNISPTLCSSISKNDIMFHYSLLHEKDYHRTIWGYLAVGYRGFDLIRNLIKKYINDEPPNLKILDFGAGHGRVTRFLVNFYGIEHVFSSDIKPDAVQFHKDFFGITSFLSSHFPDKVRCDEKFSLIFVGSLFSHLPQSSFYSWLKVLSSWLKSGGVLAFSVHDINLLGSDPSNSGFYFHNSNEDSMFPEIEGHLQEEHRYGISYVSEDFVHRTISEIFPDACLIDRIVKGFGGLQDVYVIKKK